MKEIKILIRIKDNKVAFALQRDEGDAMSLDETFKLIGALETMKQNQLKKIESQFSKVMSK